MLTRRAGERKLEKWVAIVLNSFDQSRCGRLGGLDGKVVPNLGEIGFRRLRQTEDERTANSFLPRSTMLAESKSLIRPAATSARPASMSALRADNSSI